MNSRAEGENDEMGIPNSRDRSRLDYLQFYAEFLVLKTVKNIKRQRKTHIFRNHGMISALCEFFYNALNLPNVKFNCFWYFRSLTSPSNTVYVLFFYFFLTFFAFIIYKGLVGKIINFIIFKKISI